MSDTDDEFTVRLGRIGNRRSRKTTGYLKRVRKVVAKAGVGQPRRGAAFTGSRIGRGHAEGNASAIRRTVGQRRVVVKARIARIKPGATGAVRAHLRYVQRDGVTREGNPGELYDASEETDTALLTCCMRGWVELIEGAIPSGRLNPDGSLPAGLQFDKLKTHYRLTSAGWSVINGSHRLAVLALTISMISLAVSIAANLHLLDR